MARLTRKELKSDKFALEVQHGVEYVSEHRQQMVRWGGIAVGIIVLVVAVFLYRSYQHGVRQQALHAAMQIQNATVGKPNNEFMISFPTEAERQQAATKAFSEVAAKYSGSDEGLISEFFLGTNAADQGKIPEAEKRFKLVVDSGNRPYGSLAKLALAQLYGSQGKLADGEKLIQSVIDHPTELVSKEAATVALAQLVRNSDPQRARKLLEPLRSSPRGNVSRTALSVLGDMSGK